MSVDETVVTRWWHIRHAPAINPSGRIYGQSDVPALIDDQGRFKAMASRLPGHALWLVSPLQRTRQTAEAILAHMEPPVDPRVEPAFPEQSFGDWQGRLPQEIRFESGRRDPFWLSPAVVRPPGGESFLDLMARVQPAIERLSRAHGGRDIIAVTHGGTIRAALALALSLDPETALRFAVDNVSLTRLDHIALPDGQAVWRVQGVNAAPDF